MAIQIVKQPTTITTFHAEVGIVVSLSDMEQPIVEIDKTTSYNSATNSYNKDLRKFLIKEMTYLFDTNFYKPQSQKVLSIASINGSFFLKGNKKIGGGSCTIYLHNTTKAERKLITDQIPTKLHDYAIKELETNIKNSLDYMIRVGVVI